MRKAPFKSTRNQAGWTFWSLLFISALGVFTAYIVMQMVPVYAMNANIKNAMELSVEEMDLRRVTRAQIVRGMQQQLYLDSSHKVLDYKKDLKIQRSRDQLIIETKYQSEVPIFNNISLLFKFDNRVERDLPGN
ncbi:MAG TPA: hypothetical protein DCW52_07660 [Gammaproteobacteria bacterium]|jgi:hypothetical protein|nr:hypothetical protein [Gammaproteobacteria bacterium]